MSKKHFEELDYLNAICCLLVIFIHVVSYGIETLDPASLQFASVFIPSRLSGFVVPAFLFSGAVKMAALIENNEGFSYGKYILKRIKKIYLPYAAWVIIYYFVFLATGFIQKFSLRELVGNILLGDISAQFYYVVIVMQFYLLLPLWKLIIKKLPWYTVIPVTLFISYILMNLPQMFQFFGHSFEYADRVFTSYIWYWIAGLYFGKNYDRISASLRKRKFCVFASFSVCLAFALICYLEKTIQMYVFNSTFLRQLSDSISIVVLFCLCNVIVGSGAGKLRLILKKIHLASYSVYLSHCLFIVVGTYYIMQGGIKDKLWILVFRFLLGYIPPFLIYFIASGIRGHFFGNKRSISA